MANDDDRLHNAHDDESPLDTDKVIPLELLCSVQCCTANHCLSRLSQQQLADARTTFSQKRRLEQTKYILSYLNEHRSWNTSKCCTQYLYNVGSSVVCAKAWKLALGIGTRRLERARKSVESGFIAPKPNSMRQQSGKTLAAVEWVRQFADQCGDKMPNENKTRIPSSMNKRDVYNEYKLMHPDEVIHENSFYRVWNQSLKDIVIAKDNSGFATCDTCDELRRRIMRAATPQERDEIQAVRHRHLAKQKGERQKYYKHMVKASDPARRTQYLSIIMDGMDQEKTQLPHFLQRTHFSGSLQRIKMHLTGVMVHGRSVYGYFDYGQWSHSANLNGTILLDVLSKISPLPPVLYLQMDNAADNKNQFLLALFCLMVEKRIFRKVKVNFLMVGHTHENIDQMFSCFNHKLGKSDAFNLKALMELMNQCYENTHGHKPEAIELKSVYNIKDWITPHIAKMVHHKHPHCFKITLGENNAKAIIQYKNWSSDNEWLVTKPRDDDQPYFLVDHPDIENIANAETQYYKVLGFSDQEDCNNSRVVASIRRCYEIFNCDDMEKYWEQWIQMTENALIEEIQQKENPRDVMEFETLKALLPRISEFPCVNQSVCPSSMETLPEDGNLTMNPHEGHCGSTEDVVLPYEREAVRKSSFQYRHSQLKLRTTAAFWRLRARVHHWTGNNALGGRPLRIATLEDLDGSFVRKPPIAKYLQEQSDATCTGNNEDSRNNKEDIDSSSEDEQFSVQGIFTDPWMMLQ